MHTHKTLAAIFGSIGLLALTACSTDSAESSSGAPETTETVVASETSTVQVETEAPVPSSVDTLPATSPASEDLPRAGIDVGSPISINGEEATVCIYGDGYGTNVWAAGVNTSCEFVSAVNHALVDGINPTTQNIRDFMPTSVTATSPTTGEEYTMDCATQGDELVTCRGGNNASVHFY